MHLCFIEGVAGEAPGEARRLSRSAVARRGGERELGDACQDRRVRIRVDL